MADPKHGLMLDLPGGAGRYYLLTAERITVGRARDNTIVLDVDTVSSRHCELHRRGGIFVLADLDSTNGTRVNEEPIGSKSRELNDGDEVRIGLDVRARFVRFIEIEDTGEGDAASAGEDTKKQKSLDSDVNPVAAAVARAGEGDSEER